MALILCVLCALCGRTHYSTILDYAVDKTRSSLFTSLPQQKPSQRRLTAALPASRPSRSAFGFVLEDRLSLQRKSPRQLSAGSLSRRRLERETWCAIWMAEAADKTETLIWGSTASRSSASSAVT